MKEKISETLSRLWPAYFSDFDEKEEWRQVSRTAGDYQVSSIGRLKSTRTGKILQAHTNKHGYVRTNLSLNGIVTSLLIHRLVAEAFISNPDNKTQVNHINGIKHDNRVENLEWATPRENTNHGINTGLIKRIKRPQQQILQYSNGVQAKAYSSTRDMEKDGYDRRAVYRCVNGLRKTYKGYQWYAQRTET